MRVFTPVFIAFNFLIIQSAVAQNEVRSIKTSSRPTEVKQINNTPVIYIHKSESSGERSQPMPGNQNNQRCIKKIGSAPEGNERKKELKDPVKINDN
jgi:hypothetical protein